MKLTKLKCSHAQWCLEGSRAKGGRCSAGRCSYRSKKVPIVLLRAPILTLSISWGSIKIYNFQIYLLLRAKGYLGRNKLYKNESIMRRKVCCKFMGWLMKILQVIRNCIKRNQFRSILIVRIRHWKRGMNHLLSRWSSLSEAFRCLQS
jgi:hypothetical protein